MKGSPRASILATPCDSRNPGEFALYQENSLHPGFGHRFFGGGEVAVLQVVHGQVELVHDGQQLHQQAAVGLLLDVQPVLVVPAARVDQVGFAALHGIDLAVDLFPGFRQGDAQHRGFLLGSHRRTFNGVRLDASGIDLVAVSGEGLGSFLGPVVLPKGR